MGGATGVELVGELTLPEDGPPKALLVLVSGSGAQDRNSFLEQGINHRPFLVLSNYLTRQGYGVLRYDERGVGESSGRYNGTATADLAEDTRGAVNYLRGRVDLVGIPLGIAGHSEGGQIAPRVAAGREDLVDFLVLLAAPGIRGDTLLLDQRRAMTGVIPADEKVYSAATAYAVAHPYQADSAFAAGLGATVVEQVALLPDSVRQNVADPEVLSSILVSLFSDPWLRYFVASDPVRYLEQVTVPVLAINGELDQQVTIGNLAAVGDALDRAGNQDVTLVAAPAVNHLLQPAKTGSPGEYGEIEITIDPQVMEAIVSWLDARFL